MSINPGPSYQEWLEILEHNKEIGFEELQAMALRIEQEGPRARLTEGQQADLLRRLGDLQIAAVDMQRQFAQHEIQTGPAGS